MQIGKPSVALSGLLFVFSMSLFAQSDWKDILKQRLPLYGHRNWIVVADSAYPAQARPGIETIVAGAGQLDVLRFVLNELSQSRHVRPIVYLDRELSFLNDDEAPGVSIYRQALSDLFGKQKPGELLHEQMIAKLDESAQTFRILIIKSNMTVPYTSVFLQLDCAYWGVDAERNLRAAMAARARK
jgi:hypothetical protein